MQAVLSALLLALSLCADCFAVSACSSVTLRKVSWRNVLTVSLVFAVAQSGLFVLGWLLGDAISGLIGRVAHVVGFLLLLYVGGSMLYGGIRRREEVRNLDGLGNIILGGVATSIDALAVGVSLCLKGESAGDMTLKALAILAVTFLTVVLGIFGGHAAGKRFGHIAEITGGIILIMIGLGIVLK